MDRDERYLIRIMFKNRMFYSDAQAFEDLFTKIMRYRYLEFRAVKPQGAFGDKKNEKPFPFGGGYFGTSHFIYIDGKRKNKLIRYAKTPGGMYADLKHPKNEINLHPDIVLREIPLTSQQWIVFIEDLSSLEIEYWKDKYYDNDISDGTQWEVRIRFFQRNKISKCGSNEYPPY